MHAALDILPLLFPASGNSQQLTFAMPEPLHSAVLADRLIKHNAAEFCTTLLEKLPTSPDAVVALLGCLARLQRDA